MSTYDNSSQPEEHMPPFNSDADTEELPNGGRISANGDGFDLRSHPYPCHTHPTVSGGHYPHTYALDISHQDAAPTNGYRSNAAFSSSPHGLNNHVQSQLSILFPELDGNFDVIGDSTPGALFQPNLQPPNFGDHSDFGSNGFNNNNSNIDFSNNADLTHNNHFNNNNSESEGVEANGPRLITRTNAARTGTTEDTQSLACDHPGCSTVVRRPGDLKRHKKKHGDREFPCPVIDCDKKGGKGFYRLDKLQDHQRKKHRM